jgi:alanine racemase
MATGGNVKNSRFSTTGPSGEAGVTPADVSGPWIEVDLGAIAHNLDAIHVFTQTPLMPVIKANAYGHGLVAGGPRPRRPRRRPCPGCGHGQ